MDQGTLELHARMPADEAVRAILRRQLAALEAQEAGVRRGEDPECLHDFRVAVRRSRAALGQLKGALPPEPVAALREELAWLGGVTSPTRDLDVYLLQLPDYRRNLAAASGPELEPLQAFLQNHRQQEQERLLAELDGERYARLKVCWRQITEPVPAEESAPKAARPLQRLADKRLRKAMARVLTQGQAIDGQTPAEALHELRKSGKKLRYLLEFFRGLYPEKEVGRRIAALKELQDNLGAIQDLEVQADTLLRFSRQMVEEGPVPAPTLVAMGMLVENLRHRQHQAREEFSGRFSVFAGADNRRRFKEMLRGCGGAAVDIAVKEDAMGRCLKGKSENKPKEGRFQCDKCGAVSKQESHLCKPAELSKKAAEKLDKQAKDRDRRR